MPLLLSPPCSRLPPPLVIQRAVQRNVLEQFDEFVALDSIADSTRGLLGPGSVEIGPALTTWE